MLKRASIALAVLCLAVSAFAAELPRVVIVATGGTIAGAQPKEGDAGYKSGRLSVESLIQAAPGVDKLARLDGEQVASIGSQDVNDAVWFKLARRVNELLATPDVAGIVVTHGTDTLEETGFFLDLVVKSDKPVVLVVVNDDLHAARDIQKMNTTGVQTFTSPNRGRQGARAGGGRRRQRDQGDDRRAGVRGRDGAESAKGEGPAAHGIDQDQGRRPDPALLR